MPKTDFTNNEAFLRHIIKQKRKMMPPGLRARTRKLKRTVKVIFPSHLQRQYGNFIKNIMRLFSERAMPEIRNNYSRWLKDYHGDSFSDDWSDFNDEYDDLQDDMFGDDGDGYGGQDKKKINIFLMGMAASVIAWNLKQFQKTTDALTGDIPYHVYEPWIDEVTKTWANSNFELIKSLSDDYIRQLNIIVSEGVKSGKSYESIADDLQAKNKYLSDYKARFLARDQTAKLNSQLSKRRHQEAGMDIYQWQTAEDERVRETHIPLDMKYCTYDDDSVYADTLEDAIAGNWSDRESLGAFEGIPGEDYNCRCVSIPQPAELIQDVDDEIDNEEENQ